MPTKLLITVALVTVVLSTLALAESKEFKGQSTEGWSVWDLKNNTQSTEQLKASEGALHYKYDRTAMAMLVHLTPITGLKELKITLKSDIDAPIAVGFADTDDARFHYLIDLKAGKEVTVTIKPEDFKLNEDSPVQKDKPEPDKFPTGYAIVDLGVLTGATGNNTLHIKNVVVTTGL